MQVGCVHDIDVVMTMYNLMEYRDNYLKTSGILRQCCRDEPGLAANVITHFNAANAMTNLFKIKEKIAGKQTTMKYVEIMVPLPFFENSWNAFN